MALKLILLAVVTVLYTSEAASRKNLGGEDYLPCEQCNLPKAEYPTEGKMACYSIKRVTRTISRRVKICRTIECDPFDFFCSPQECRYQQAEVPLLDCELSLRVTFKDKEISQRNETYGTIYQINTPQYFLSNRSYPESMYCIWNIADKGIITYQIVAQELQEPADCEGQGCDCPDVMTIGMGVNQVKLCGNEIPQISRQMSTDGLKVEFCSDNMHGAKGILLMAYQYTNQAEMEQTRTTTNELIESRRKRQQPLQPEPSQPASCPELVNMNNEMANNMSEMGCQYEFMMRMTQPGVPCPDDQTIVTMVKNHDYMMSGFKQTMQMCDGMDGLSTRMPMMNSIESCAVQYLYRTRDCEFAKSLVDSANGELSDVARMIANNNFPIKVPNWFDIDKRRKCR